MKKNKKVLDAPREGFVRVMQEVKDGKGNTRFRTKDIPQHLSEKPRLMRRMGIVLEGDKAFVTKEQIEQEKQTFTQWADGIESVSVLEGMISSVNPIEKTPFKVDIIKERIKQLSAKSQTKIAKKEETPITPQQ